jgi:DNA-binding GntR family transcriptional regulator
MSRYRHARLAQVTMTSARRIVRPRPGRGAPARRPSVTVDPASEWPLSAQPAQLLRAQIRAAGLDPGARVPGEQDLARGYRVSRATASRALDALAAEGLITRRRGAGSAVAAVAAIAELHPVAGTRISARLSATGERAAAGAGL